MFKTAREAYIYKGTAQHSYTTRRTSTLHGDTTRQRFGRSWFAITVELQLYSSLIDSKSNVGIISKRIIRRPRRHTSAIRPEHWSPIQTVASTYRWYTSKNNVVFCCAFLRTAWRRHFDGILGFGAVPLTSFRRHQVRHTEGRGEAATSYNGQHCHRFNDIFIHSTQIYHRNFSL